MALYWKLRDDGYSTGEAATMIGKTRQTGYNIEKRGRPVSMLNRKGSFPSPKTLDQLDGGVKDTLTDFSLFREVFLARRKVPWAQDAAERTVEWLTDRSEETYAVMNMPPGAGKTTLFTFDIPLWLICGGGVADPEWGRAIRIMLGSATKNVSQDYVTFMRNTLDRSRPFYDKKAKREAEMVLAAEFGRFRPKASQGEDSLWTKDAFFVAQIGDLDIYDKEPNVQAASRESGFLGERVDYVVWDDLVNKENSRSIDQATSLAEWFEDEAEPRLEPGGLLALVGQRLGPLDLYRNRLDTTYVDDDGNEIRSYEHIVYPMHNEGTCDGDHRQWDAKEDGCLLDAERLSWKKVLKVSSKINFRTVHQQEDTNPADTLVQRAWLYGERDATGYEGVGCFDRERGFLEWPMNVPTYDVVSVDPSAANFWVAEWKAWDLDGEYDWLIYGERRRMTAGGSEGFLDWDPEEQRHVGLMEDLQSLSGEMGHPIRLWIVESNAAHRYLFQTFAYKTWRQKWPMVDVVPHQCVDLETEVLSKRGWLNYSSITEGDEILTLNMVSGLAEWKPVNFVYRGISASSMGRIKNRSIDALVTRDHKWAVTDQQMRPLKFVETHDLRTGNVIPLARPLTPEQDPEPTYTDAFVELVGWAVTEGHFHKVGYGITIGQSPTANPENVERIRLLLKGLRANFSEGTNGKGGEGGPVVTFTLTKDVARAVRAVTGGRKHIPSWFIGTLSEGQRQLLLDTMIEADGWVYGTTVNFCSDDESLIQAIEMLAALQGRPTYRTTRKDRPHHKVVRIKQASHCYLGNHPKVEWDPMPYGIWCPNTDNGTFYARRGGRTYFTGNTQRNKNDIDYGVFATLPMRYKTGRTRLPKKRGDVRALNYMHAKEHELTTYPFARTDDTIMADWFQAMNRERIAANAQRIKAAEPVNEAKLPPYLARRGAFGAG